MLLGYEGGKGIQYCETIFPDDVLMVNTSGTFHIRGYYPNLDTIYNKRSYYNLLEIVEKYPNGFPPRTFILKKNEQ
jgi:hypothetical protein